MSYSSRTLLSSRVDFSSYFWRGSLLSKIDDAHPPSESTNSSDSDSESPSSESDSDSNLDSDSSSPVIFKRSPSKITDKQRTKLSVELEQLTSNRKPGEAVDDDYDSEEDGPRKKGASANPVSAFSTKHELEDPPIPLVEIEELEAEERMEVVGSIMSIVGSAVIVQAFDHGSHRVLDTGSVLAFENRKVLGAVSMNPLVAPSERDYDHIPNDVFGQVFEAFGPVMKPLYSIRFPSSEKVASNTNIDIGSKVFYVPGRSTFLFTSALRYD